MILYQYRSVDLIFPQLIERVDCRTRVEVLMVSENEFTRSVSHSKEEYNVVWCYVTQEYVSVDQ